MININKSFYIKIWLFVFFYILIVGLFFQLVVLPLFLPSWHASDGLMSGGDWVGFQYLALELLDEMEITGWRAWHLSPGDQAPAGIAAAVYKLTGISKPWVLLPLNAAIHAFSAIVLMLIIKNITGYSNHPKKQMLPVLPFIFFPTALLWNTQFHKDGLFILGAYLFLYGFIKITETNINYTLNDYISTYFYMLSGMLMVWVMRPYGIDMLIYIGLLMIIMLSIYQIYLILIKKVPLKYNLVIIWLAVLSVMPLSMSAFQYRYVVIDYEELEEQVTVVDHDTKDSETSLTYVKDSSNQVESEGSLDYTMPVDSVWQSSDILPQFIDEVFYKMAVLRDHYRVSRPYAGSNIDLDIQFNSATDLIKYIPRALQLGLLASFPQHWFAQGTSLPTTVMRRVTAFEMIAVYGALFGVAAAFWFWRKNIRFYLVSGFALAMILTYSLVVVNIGTLHRMRYGFLMILVALGLAAVQEFFRKRAKDEKAK